MDQRIEFMKLCVTKMHEKNIYDDIHKQRLEEEMWEINARDKFSYFLDLYDRKVKYAHNQNNLLVVELLDIAPGFDINKPPECTIGDFPDIDIDYLKPIRDYLKNEWAPEFFKRECVSNIGSYNTFGMKSALIDMAKVHGLERNEILSLTTNIKAKDDDGKPITWETALQMSKKLKDYCEKNKDVATAAQKIMDRNRSRGKHAGGLIIANTSLDSLVPLVIDTQGQITSAWTEGLHAQDLSPIGLIKFDLLVITNNEQVAKISKLIKERHGIDSICALPGKGDWTDIKYLNDPKALALANRGMLKGIFQFDSPGIRALVTKGGVKSFDDLVAYTALFRPGPLECLPKGSKINLSNGKVKNIEDLSTWNDEILYVNSKGKTNSTKKFMMLKAGKKKLCKIKLKSGKEIIVGTNHKFLTPQGYVEAHKLKNMKVAYSNRI